VKNRGACVLIHENSGQRTALADVECVTQK
jgi:hypothetical protein